MIPDRKFYEAIYGGEDIPDIDRLLTVSGREIDLVIMHPPDNDFSRRQYDLAVCAQAEYMGLCGGVEAWQSLRYIPGSFSVGSFSMSGSSGGSENGSRDGICSRSLSYLEKGGLLYRGCRVWN